MENSKSQNSKSQNDKAQADESKAKTGVIPKEEFKGSDADSAYNEDQEFATPKNSESEKEEHKTGRNLVLGTANL